MNAVIIFLAKWSQILPQLVRGETLADGNFIWFLDELSLLDKFYAKMFQEPHFWQMPL